MAAEQVVHLPDGGVRRVWLTAAVLVAAFASGACGGGGPDPGAADVDGASGPASRIALEIAVFDDTAAQPPAPDAELWVRGFGSWFPELAFGADRAVLGQFAPGSGTTIFIYPDGREGVEIAVAFEATAQMVSGSDRDRTVVAIGDREVVVRGTGIVGGPQVYARQPGGAPRPGATEPAAFPAALRARFVAEIRTFGRSEAHADCLLAAIAARVTPHALAAWLDRPASDPTAAQVDRELTQALADCSAE